MNACAVFAATWSVLLSQAPSTTTGVPAPAVSKDVRGKSWTVACSPENDLHRVITSSGYSCRRCATAAEAVRAAEEGSGVLILADGYPDKLTVVALETYREAQRKRLHLYVEYPEQLPNLTIGQPRTITFERGVVTSGVFGKPLPPMRIILISSCRYVPVPARETHLVMAKVAGVDTAVFGLKGTPADPILFDHPSGNLLVATTKLSHFVTGRYLPAEAWRTIWQTILHRLNPDGPPVKLQWTPSVRPRF